MKLAKDTTLLQGFRSGDNAALAEVYTHYAPLLYQHLRQGFSFSSQGQWFRVYGITNAAEQESLVQETFVRCFAKKVRLSYDSSRPFWPYVMRTCERLLIEERRRDKRIVPLTEEALTTLPAGEESAEESLEQQELLALLSAYLVTCNPREHDVFQALYERGMSQQEAAKHLGLGRMQIRTSLAKLRRGLLGFLQEKGYLHSMSEGKEAALGALLLYLGL